MDEPAERFADEQVQSLYTAWRAVSSQGVKKVDFYHRPTSSGGKPVTVQLILDDDTKVEFYVDEADLGRLKSEPMPRARVQAISLTSALQRTGLRGLCNVVKLVGKTFFVLGAAAVFAGYFEASRAGTPPPSLGAIVSLGVALVLTAALAWIFDALATHQEERQKSRADKDDRSDS